jgi:hypothetical protein
MANFPSGPGFGSINDIGGAPGGFPPAPAPVGGVGMPMPTQGIGGSPGGLGNMVGVQLGQLPQAPSQPFVGATPLPVTPHASLTQALTGAAPAPAAPAAQPTGTGLYGNVTQAQLDYINKQQAANSLFGLSNHSAGGDAGYGGGMGF